MYSVSENINSEFNSYLVVKIKESWCGLFISLSACPLSISYSNDTQCTVCKHHKCFFHVRRLTSRKRRDVGVQVCVWHDVTFWNGFMLYFSSTLNLSVLFSWLLFCPLVSHSELITHALFMQRMRSYCSNWLTAQRREWWFGDCGCDVRRWHMRDWLASAALYSVWLGCDLISRTLESHDVHNYLAA